MGRALLTSAKNATLQSNPDLRFTKGKFVYRILTKGAESIYSVSEGGKTLSLPIAWTFGAEAQTYLLNRDGVYLESMVSYYPETGGLDVTVGDQALAPKTLEEALGRPLTADVVTACFNCHSANSTVGHKLSFQRMEPGVTCARCHVEATAHAASFTIATKTKVLPERLGKRPAEAVSNFCGQCHRSWETVVRNNWRGPSNVRFQPYRLARSECFDGADARISCLACHNPHENLTRNDAVKGAATYDAKCVACHGVSTKRCTVAQAGCVTCHMPKVRLPGGHQTFTDHFIRVVKAGAAYPD